MKTAMNMLEQTIRRARRRGIANEAVHRGGAGAAWGLAVGMLMLLIDRISPASLPFFVYFILPALGMTVGIIHATVTHPATFEIALRIDRAMRLKDRVATAHALVSKGNGHSGIGPRHDDAFAAIVNRDAERLAGRLDIRTIAPLRMSRTWMVAAGLAVALWLGHTFLPGVAWAEADDRQPPQGVAVSPEQQQQEREELRQRIEESVERFKRDLIGEDEDAARDLPIDPRVREQLDALERLAHQLSGEGVDQIDVEQARDESAARLNELAEQIARDARRDREAVERLTERFAGMDPPQTPMTAREFQDALRRGEYGRAADLLDEQLNRKEDLAEQDRLEFADHLRDLDELLDEQSREEMQQLLERAAQLEQVLRDHDMDDELIRELLQGERLTREEMERLLQDEGVDEDLANRLARELERLRNEGDLLEQMERDIEAVRDALRQAAEELDEAEDLPQPDERDEEQRHDPVDAADADDPDAPEELEPADAADPADRDPAVEREPDSPDEPHGEPDDAPAKEPEETEQREVAEERPADDPDAEREPVAEDPDAEATEQPEIDPDAPDAAAEPEVEGDPDATEPGQETGPTDELPQPGEMPGVDPDAPDAAEETIGEDAEDIRRSAADRLRELDDRRKQSQEREQISEEMIERARELIERMDPEQRRQLAEELQRQMQDADPSQLDGMDFNGDEAGVAERPTAEGEPVEHVEREVDDIDLTPDDEEFDRVLAEWLSDDELTPDPDLVQRREVTEERVREARRVAERAVEDAAVPSRYHQFIRRYFQRLEERTEDQ